VGAALREASWNLGRKTKQALPNLKGQGDLSAHSRRLTARRQDVDKLRPEFRLVVEELVFLAGLR
jgi:hypothetical protein